jgi:hypothetical protein
MATAAYMSGRKRYSRPQGILWSENPGTLQSGMYVPEGFEIGAYTTETTNLNQFLILSDHNRSPLQFNSQRIEQRQRMVNGNMRSFHIADKNTLSVSWQNLPSRSYFSIPNWATTGATTGVTTQSPEYTADGGAGGVEMLDWYENHTGPFWMFLAYDKFNNYVQDGTSAPYTHLEQYNQIVQVYVSDFSYTVSKRGQSNHDLWDITVSLEEV